MLNTEAVEVIARHRGNAVVIVTMSTIFSYPNAADDDLVIRVAPLMGGASSIGLGVALACPERRVLVLDGDGSLLMQLGALATIAGTRAPNLYHFVFNNRLLYEGGGRVDIANGPAVDFAAMARAAGYAQASSFSEAEALDEELSGVFAKRGPALIALAIEPPPTPRWSNENPQAELPDWWFTMMREDSEAAARALQS